MGKGYTKDYLDADNIEVKNNINLIGNYNHFINKCTNCLDSMEYYNRNFDMRNLKFYRVGKDVYEPDITTMGEYLDRINPDLRERMIDRLIALQTNEAEIKKYKIIDEDVYSNVESKMEQEETKKQKKNKNREAR